MSCLKIAVFGVLVTCLLAASKSVTVTCGTCKNTPAGCVSGFCYLYTGVGISYESCIGGSGCDIVGNTTVTVSSCTLDYGGNSCLSNICVYLPNITLGISPQTTCAPATYTLTGSCSSSPAIDCLLTGNNCTSCEKLVSNATGQTTTSFVCASYYNAVCYSLTATVTTSTCTADSFGVPTTCCNKYGFSTNNVGICSSNIGALNTPSGASILRAWLTTESMLLLSTIALIGALLI